jgi:hypothetical protein
VLWVLVAVAVVGAAFFVVQRAGLLHRRKRVR